MFQVLGLDHVVIRAIEPERMVEFYCDVVGCSLERRLDEIGLIQLRAGSALIDLVPVDSELGRMGGTAPGKEGRNMDHFCLRIDPFDPDALAAHLQAKGLEPGAVKRRYGAQGFGPSLYLEDPEGNVVELKGPPEASDVR